MGIQTFWPEQLNLELPDKKAQPQGKDYTHLQDPRNFFFFNKLIFSLTIVTGSRLFPCLLLIISYL